MRVCAAYVRSADRRIWSAPIQGQGRGKGLHVLARHGDRRSRACAMRYGPIDYAFHDRYNRRYYSTEKL